MGRKPKARPSFFKVLIKYDFARQLQLPPVFVQKCGDILLGNAKLRTRSGKTWDVKLDRIEVEKCYFTRGWTKFTEDLGLKMGDFLVFWFAGKSTFDVSVYGINCCEREISACNSGFEDSDSDEEVEILSIDYACTNQNPRDVSNKQSKSRNLEKQAAGTDSTLKEMNPLYFELVLKKHHRSRLSLRKEFAVKSGLINQERVVLEYVPKQRFTPVILVKSSSAYRLDLAAGWSEFKNENGLNDGKTYSFEFNSRKNVIEINEFKKQK